MPTRKPRYWTLHRVLVGVVLANTAVGPLVADLLVPKVAAMHLHNPAWPPHAKFHDAQYISVSAVVGLTGIIVLRRRRGDLDQQFRVAAALGSATWIGMFAALLFPGTAVIDPEFEQNNRRVLGLDAQLFIATVTVLCVAGSLKAVDTPFREDPVHETSSSSRWLRRSLRSRYVRCTMTGRLGRPKIGRDRQRLASIVEPP